MSDVLRLVREARSHLLPAGPGSVDQSTLRRNALGTESPPTRDVLPATLADVAKVKEQKVTTAWGDAQVLEQLTLPQRSGDKRFASVIQLLEAERGERMVRFAYTTDGVARRGPVTLRARDLERLRAALEEHPGLAEALGGVA